MITTTNCRVTAVGTGAAQTVSFTFPITNNSDVVVAKVLIASPYTATILTELTDYTVVNSGDAGGSISTVTPYIANTYNIAVYRRTSPTQEVDLVNGGAFDGPTIEASLDRLTKLCQENQDAMAASISIPGGVYTPGTAALLNVMTAAVDPTAVSDSDSVVPTTAWVDAAIDNIDLTGLLTLTGDQTISSGIKTFSVSPVVPTPTTSGQAATKGYADSLVGAGSIVGRILAQTATPVAMTTPAITVSNTIMAYTAGAAVGLSAAITPKSVLNTIQAEVLLNVASAGIITVFLLQGSTVVASAVVPACTTGAQVSLTFNVICTGLTTAQTFTVRAGCSTGNLYVNRTTALSAPFGGTWISSLTLTEIHV